MIFNVDDEPIEMKKAQYFINLPVEGHILGTLWVLTIGALWDTREEAATFSMYEHSYGNRLRKTSTIPTRKSPIRLICLNPVFLSTKTGGIRRWLTPRND